jgi:hypothetical protein
MRAGSKGARDFFGRERALSASFAGGGGGASSSSDVISGGERRSSTPAPAAPRIRRSRVESIQGGSKGALSFFGGSPHP